MRRPLFLALALILLMAFFAACGEASTPEEEATQPPATTPPEPTNTPEPTEAMMEEEATEAPDELSPLEQYAAEHAGGPGAIYVGDITQLVGPAKTVEQGDETVVRGTACPGMRNGISCDIRATGLRGTCSKEGQAHRPHSPGVDGDPTHHSTTTLHQPCPSSKCGAARILCAQPVGTYQRESEFITSSFPEFGAGRADTLSLVTDGTRTRQRSTAGMSAAKCLPLRSRISGASTTAASRQFEATQAFIKDIEELVLAEDRRRDQNHNWYSGNDQFFFCREKIETLDDFEGKKTRSHSAALSDWINGMGASAQFLAFAEVYTAIERGILDCGVTGADAGFGQRWYEVTDYIIGPLVSFPSNNNVINAEKWASIPENLQQIILEEAAKSELEALRISAIQNEMGLLKNTSDDPRGAGQDAMEFVPFSEEMTFRSLNTSVMEHVVPAWVNRVGDTSHPIIADTFNNKVGPIVGLRIDSDGSVIKLE